MGEKEPIDRQEFRRHLFGRLLPRLIDASNSEPESRPIRLGKRLHVQYMHKIAMNPGGLKVAVRQIPPMPRLRGRRQATIQETPIVELYVTETGKNKDALIISTDNSGEVRAIPVPKYKGSLYRPHRKGWQPIEPEQQAFVLDAIQAAQEQLEE